MNWPKAMRRWMRLSSKIRLFGRVAFASASPASAAVPGIDRSQGFHIASSYSVKDSFSHVGRAAKSSSVKMIKPWELFRVETLDTRLASTTNVPRPDAKPSRWNTPEYYLYYFIFLTIPPLMFKSVYDVSQPSHPTYSQYEHLLSPGWIPGRRVDNSDAQYAGFRGNIPYMALLLVLHPILRRVVDSFTQTGDTSKVSVGQKKPKTAGPGDGDVRLQARVNFDLAFAAIFLLALHGLSAFKILLILYLNYTVGTALPKKYAGAATWAFNMATLFSNEIFRGYRFAALSAFFSSENAVFDQSLGAKLDSYGGLIPRWEVLFNITVLRLIAFNFDYIWMLDRKASSPIEVCPSYYPVEPQTNAFQKKSLDPTALPEKERVAIGANPSDFTFKNYLAYVLYSPLYLVGPIINFNDYIAQSRYQLPSISTQRIIPYAVRFLFCLLTMELVLHFLYAVAICNAKPNWSLYTPFQLSMLGYFNLHIIWLKLLIPWRFFRLWALVDGIDPPENMVRCMSDNFSTMAFWRGWHRSFQRFIVRYIFIPLGGSRVKSKAHMIANMGLVFTFVAVWHDLNLRLLVWGWLLTVFVLPEVILNAIFPARKFQDRPNTYRWLQGVIGVGNILMLMIANLVGFAVGVDGLKGLVAGIVGDVGGRVFFLGACATLFVGVQVMFEWRESEKRRGIDLKY